MSIPRLEISISKIRKNAEIIKTLCEKYGATLVLVTKCFGGDLEILSALADLNITGVGDSRIRNIRQINRINEFSNIQLIRTPGLGQIRDVVELCDLSFNTEVTVINSIAKVARSQNIKHKIILMLEIGEGREGISPMRLMDYIQAVDSSSHLSLAGLGATVGCLRDSYPLSREIDKLISAANRLERPSKLPIKEVSIGGSAILPLIQNGNCPKGITQIRIGEAIALGTDGIHGRIENTFNDAFTFKAEVIEIKIVDSKLIGTAYYQRCLLGFGYQDADHEYLQPVNQSIKIMDSTSDHTIAINLDPRKRLRVGQELAFFPKYRSLVQLMNSKYVEKVYIDKPH